MRFTNSLPWSYFTDSFSMARPFLLLYKRGQSLAGRLTESFLRSPNYSLIYGSGVPRNLLAPWSEA